MRPDQAPIPPSQGDLCFRGEGVPVQTAPVFGAPWGSRDGGLPPADNRHSGEWERTVSESRRFGILLVASPHRSLPGWHVRLPLAPLLSALGRAGWPAARWGPSLWWGAAISAAISWIKTRNAVCPIATVVLYFDASQRPPFPFCDSAKNPNLLGRSQPSALCRHDRLLRTIPQWFVRLSTHP